MRSSVPILLQGYNVAYKSVISSNAMQERNDDCINVRVKYYLIVSYAKLRHLQFDIFLEVLQGHDRHEQLTHPERPQKFLEC